MLAAAENRTLKKPPAEAGDKFRYARPEGQGVNFRSGVGYPKESSGQPGQATTPGKAA